jgi:hypothetical protein
MSGDPAVQGRAATAATARPPRTPPSLLSTRRFVLVVGAGVLAAFAVPFSALGSGLALVGLVTAGIVLVERPVGDWDEPWRRVAVACAVAAAPLPAVSDAGWVVGPVLLGAVVLAVVALAGGTGWSGLSRPLPSVVPAGFRSAAAIARTARQRVPHGRRVGPVVRAAALTGVLLGVFGALFVSADRLFGRLVERFLVSDLDLPVLVVRLGVGAMVTVAVATVAGLPRRSDDEPPLPPPARTLRGVEWLLPLVALVTLFGLFVVVQFGVLFGGHARVLRTSGLTYAEYARSGFAQLVVVALLTLVVIAGTARYAPARSRREALARQGLLAALCLFTVVILVSAHHRLALYEEAFGFTRLRFGARAAIWWLAVVFVLLLLAGASRRTSALPRTIVLATGVAIVAVGYLRPDALIARWNVERFELVGAVDTAHLAGLSADAVPGILELPPGVRGCALEGHAARIAAVERADEWSAWNLSRDRAVAALRDQPGDRACRG